MRVVFLIFLLLVGPGCDDEGTNLKPDSGSQTDLELAPDTVISDVSTPDMFTMGELTPGNWITVQAGNFTMGSQLMSVCREADETSHQVTLSRSFSMAEKEVTQQQFQSLMLYNPSFHTDCGEDCPVEWVTWHEAVAYCNNLSRAKDKPQCYSCTGMAAETHCELTASDIYECEGYRLPTEAEWEYAAGCGTTTDFHNGNIADKYVCMGTEVHAEEISWYKANSLGVAHPTGQMEPNPWKLYDMNGNVYEWVHDWYVADLGTGDQTDPAGPATGTERVFRGGSWFHNAEHARSAARERFTPEKPFTFTGFRCVISL